MHFIKHTTYVFTYLHEEMTKLGKLGFFVLLLFLSSSTCSAWFGSKHKSSTSNGKNSILPYEQASSSSSSSSPSFLNRFRAGSSVVFPVHGNVYPVGYVKGTPFSVSLCLFFCFGFTLCLSFSSLVFFFMPFPVWALSMFSSVILFFAAYSWKE